MANVTPLRKQDPESEKPVNISDRAIDNLAFIRETMARSTQFTAVPGYGGILMGVTACVAAYIASIQIYRVDSLTVWLIEAALAFAIGLLAMWQKAKLGGQSLLSTPSRKFAFSFAPPMFVGVVTVLGLWKFGQYDLMAPVCMLAYGAAVACGGAFSVRIIPVMGWLFMACGAIAFLLPTKYADPMMAVSFGGLHIIFGAIIARRYGG